MKKLLAGIAVLLMSGTAHAGMAIPNTGWTGAAGFDYAITGDTDVDWDVINNSSADSINSFARDNGLDPLGFDRDDTWRANVALGRSWHPGLMGDKKDRTTIGAYLDFGPAQETETTFSWSRSDPNPNLVLNGMVHADIEYSKFYANFEYARQVANNVNVGVHLRGGAVLAGLSDGVVDGSLRVDYREKSKTIPFSAAGCDDDQLTWGVQPGLHAEYEFTNQIAVGLQASWSYIDGPTFTCQDKVEVETDDLQDWQFGLYGKFTF